MRKRVLCALTALVLLLSCAAAACADEALPPLKTPTELPGFTAVPVCLDGLLFSRAYGRGSAFYIPVRPLCERFDIAMDWHGDGDGFTLTLDGLQVEGKAGQQYFIADGRYLYAPEDWLILRGELYLPEWALCRLLNLRSRYGDDILYLDAGEAALLRGGPDYYELNFPMEDRHWLSHIIASEAGIEPLEGKIGVGNVVLNRVRDPDFPDTIFGVVYDYEHTIQFEPVSKGTIHDDPKPEDIIAAFLVLEGANTAGDCLYFVNPDFGSFWFDNNLEFVMKLGRHNFYVSKVHDDAGTSAGTDIAAGS